jgi:hypothetical protein
MGNYNESFLSFCIECKDSDLRINGASNSNIATLERLQSKVLRIITDAPRYVPNAVIKSDLKVLSVREAVRNCSVTCRQRLDDHPNRLAKSLFQRTHYNRRLKQYYPADLATRF